MIRFHIDEATREAVQLAETRARLRRGDVPEKFMTTKAEILRIYPRIGKDLQSYSDHQLIAFSKAQWNELRKLYDQ